MSPTSSLSRSIVSSVVALLLSATAVAQGTLKSHVGEAAQDWFGSSIALFDVDGDGLAEVVSSGPRGEGNGGPYGHVKVLAGGTGLVMYTLRGDPGPSSGGWFGSSVANAGDVDLDGRDDIVVGAHQFTIFGQDPGYLRVFAGDTGAQLLHVDGVQSEEGFGWSVTGLGDVNGDSISDVAGGALHYNSDRGIVRVISGADGSVLYSVTGASAGDQFGYAVAGVGDANGDGTLDFAVGAPKAKGGGFARGMVRLFSGSNGVLLRTWTGDDDYDQLGFSVAAAGELDGDGEADVVAGMIGDATNGNLAGAVRAFSYSSDVLFTVPGEAASDWMGSSVAAAGDVNADGRDDVLAGARATSVGALFSGSAYLISGADGSILWRVSGALDRDKLGVSVAGGADFDGDGSLDMVVGANQDGNGGEGYLRVVASNTAGVATYCTAKTNSQGCLPRVTWAGSPSLTSPYSFAIGAENVLNNKNGIFFYGFAPKAAPFQGGVLCVAAPVRRTAVQSSAGNPPPDDCSGRYGFDMNARIQSGIDPTLSAGVTAYGQYWSRDPASASSTGLTDGASFTIQP